MLKSNLFLKTQCWKSFLTNMVMCFFGRHTVETELRRFFFSLWSERPLSSVSCSYLANVFCCYTRNLFLVLKATEGLKDYSSIWTSPKTLTLP
jgi:hypothetical protein